MGGSSGTSSSLIASQFLLQAIWYCAVLQAAGAADKHQHVTHYLACFQCLYSVLCSRQPRLLQWQVGCMTENRSAQGASRFFNTLRAFNAGHLVHCAVFQAAGPAGEQPRAID